MVLDKPIITNHDVSKEEIKALCEIYNNKDLTIRKVNKGSAVVIMVTKECDKNMKDILPFDESENLTSYCQKNLLQL